MLTPIYAFGTTCYQILTYAIHHANTYPCIWYQLLPNHTICYLHANTHPCVWYQMLPNPKICHLQANTHPCIWYQLLPNPVIWNIHANTRPRIWYQLLPNTIICHLHLNTHPCGSCTRNVHFVVRSNRFEIFIVFCMLRSWGPWILRIFDPILLFHRGFLKILDLHFSFLRWDPGDPGRILIGYSICKGKLYHRLKKNIPESESRQLDRLRLRLWLLARCHDSGRLRLRLGHRLHTPAMGVFLKIETEHILEICLELSAVSFPSGTTKLFFRLKPLNSKFTH